jgi:hypothetical protein
MRISPSDIDELTVSTPPSPPIEDGDDDDDGCDDCVCYQRGVEDGLYEGWSDAFYFLNPSASDSDFHFSFANFLRSIEEDNS